MMYEETVKQKIYGLNPAGFIDNRILMFALIYIG